MHSPDDTFPVQPKSPVGHGTIFLVALASRTDLPALDTHVITGFLAEIDSCPLLLRFTPMQFAPITTPHVSASESRTVPLLHHSPRLAMTARPLLRPAPRLLGSRSRSEATVPLISRVAQLVVVRNAERNGVVSGDGLVDIG